jgi:hypothetical protein
MAPISASALARLRNSIAAAHRHSAGSRYGLDFSDDGLDFQPTAYPLRELVTGSIFLFAVIVFAVWGGWQLLSLL